MNKLIHFQPRSPKIEIPAIQPKRSLNAIESEVLNDVAASFERIRILLAEAREANDKLKGTNDLSKEKNRL